MMTQAMIDTLLLSAPSNHIGAQLRGTVTVALTPERRQALQDLGLIGPNDGLTMKGSIHRERVDTIDF